MSDGGAGGLRPFAGGGESGRRRAGGDGCDNHECDRVGDKEKADSDYDEKVDYDDGRGRNDGGDHEKANCCRGYDDCGEKGDCCDDGGYGGANDHYYNGTDNYHNDGICAATEKSGGVERCTGAKNQRRFLGKASRGGPFDN